jgi:hypothetical protein
MAQFSVEIIRQTGSLLSGNQHDHLSVPPAASCAERLHHRRTNRKPKKFATVPGNVIIRDGTSTSIYSILTEMHLYCLEQ